MNQPIFDENFSTHSEREAKSKELWKALRKLRRVGWIWEQWIFYVSIAGLWYPFSTFLTRNLFQNS